MTDVDDYNSAVDAAKDRYEPRVRELLDQYAAAFAEDGWEPDDAVDEMHDTTYRWEKAMRDPADPDGQVFASVRIELEEAIGEIDGDPNDSETPYGVNFTLHADLGHRTPVTVVPHNFSPDVWVDVRDRDALEDRFLIVESLPIHDVVAAVDVERDTVAAAEPGL